MSTHFVQKMKNHWMIKERIKLIRLQKAKNASDFARQLGLETRTYLSYERGERNPSLEFLQKLKQDYNVDLNWLLTGEGNTFSISSFNRKKTENHTLKNPDRIIQKLRAQNDLTIAQFCTITGIKEEDIVDCINNDSFLSLKDALLIVNNFNVTLDDLFLN